MLILINNNRHAEILVHSTETTPLCGCRHFGSYLRMRHSPCELSPWDVRWNIASAASSNCKFHFVRAEARNALVHGSPLVVSVPRRDHHCYTWPLVFQSVKWLTTMRWSKTGAWQERQWSGSAKRFHGVVLGHRGKCGLLKPSGNYMHHLM
jgi:hypothetical protein